MTNTALTQYIKHYIEKDKTKSAIMLSGDWGTGKSHYIQHELVPELEKDSKTQCVTVSLYGIKSVNEISKSIYLEIRAKKLQLNGEAATAGKVIGKTLLKGVTSFFGVDLSSNEADMQQLYESIDLSGKLIVLEDLERSQIDILELLGYINNLVEQDSVKVLLVANEHELIKYEIIQQDHEAKKRTTGIFSSRDPSPTKVYTEKTKQYLAVKEKTVGDTLQFEGDLETAIHQIIVSYENPILNRFSDGCVNNICEILQFSRSNNLRSFIFACQKTVDIFEQLPTEYDDENFIKCIFYSIIFFALRLKSGKNLRWDDSEIYSVNLGHETFPLFKFCYEYIMFQELDVSKIPVAYNALKEKLLYDKHKTYNNPDILALCNYHLHNEDDVLKAVDTVTKRLENPEDISFYDYGNIAIYLVVIKDILGCNIDTAKTLLVRNLEGRGNDLQLERIFRTSLGETSPSARKEYEALRREMGNALKKGTQVVPGFDYLPEQSESFYAYVIKNEGLFYMGESFAGKLDVQRLAQMFAMCSPEQKDNIRGAFATIYRSDNLRPYITNDYSAVQELLQAVEADIATQTDKIQKLQYTWFIGNLTDILHRME